MRHKIFGSLALSLALVATPSFAQEEEASGPIDIEFNLAGVSDYRFRGVSLSSKDPAFQPSVTVSHESGFFASVWGSNIASNPGDDIEVDLTLGFEKEVGDFTLGASGVYYLYPGFSDANYVEFLGSVGSKVGPGTVKFNVAYAPSQDALGNDDSFYWGVSGELPINNTPLTLVGSIGVEDNSFYSKKVDWTVGVNADVAGFTVGAAYVDTARTLGDPNAKATAVLSVSRSF